MSRQDKRLIAQKNALDSVNYRRAGLSYREIASQLNISKSAAHRYVTKALQELDEQLNESTRNLRSLELERLDNLQRALWQDAMRGNPQSVDKVLKVMDHRAKIAGLYAPAKIANTDLSGENPSDGIYLLPATLSPKEWLEKYGNKDD